MRTLQQRVAQLIELHLHGEPLGYRHRDKIVYENLELHFDRVSNDCLYFKIYNTLEEQFLDGTVIIPVIHTA